MTPYRQNTKPTWTVHYRWQLLPIFRGFFFRKYLIGYDYMPTSRTFEIESEAEAFMCDLEKIQNWDACARIEKVDAPQTLPALARS